MRVLVTGGAGFIGANFIHFWMKEHGDDEIVNFDKLTYAANPESLASVAESGRYTFEKGDIADPERVNEVFDKHRPDLVVHFAAESHVDRSLNDRTHFVLTNMVGTQVLLDASLKHETPRFHHISTDEVFGAIEENEDRSFSENTAYDPRNPYSASKAGSDHLVRSYHYTFGIPATVTNCSNNYGPFHTPEKMIPLAITNLLEGKRIPVYGQGLQSRDWLHVEDHCRAIDAVIDRGEIGRTYCVGGLRGETTNIELARQICELLGIEPDDGIEFVPDRRGHDFKYVVDWTRIGAELGWKPSMSLERGLAATVDWYKANRSWWLPIKERQPAFARMTVR